MNQTTRFVIACASIAGPAALVGCSGGGGGGGAFSVLPASVTISIEDVSQDEGQAGDSTFDFVVTLSEPHPGSVVVDYATIDGTAQDEDGDGDYESSSGTLTFAPGSVAQTIQVTVRGDVAYELDETFQVVLSNAQGTHTSILESAGNATIGTDDFATNAELEIQSASYSEGNAGPQAFDFTVRLSAPLANDVTVQFTTSEGTAEDEGGDGDFQSSDGTLTIPSGYLEQHLFVLVQGDSKVESTESFSVDLSGVTGVGVNLAAAQATGTIQNEDSAGIFVDDLAVLEHDFGDFELVFDVALSAEHSQLVSVDFATNDGTASSGGFDGDYVPLAGTLFFEPGTTSLQVSVSGVGDFAGEGDEYFTLDLSRETGADLSILDGQAFATLVDNDVDEQVDTDVTGGLSFRPQVAAADGHVYTAWFDERDGQADVYFSASGDAGSSWFTNDLRLDTDVPGAARSSGVRLAAEGSRVYVVWQDERDGQSDVYFNCSSDHGLTWLANDLRLDQDGSGPSNSTDPVVACANGRVLVAWTDDRDGLTDVYFRGSNDGGTSWQASSVRLDLDLARAPGASASTRPQIAASGNRVHVAWVEDGDVVSNSSPDGGASWFPEHVRIDREHAPATAAAENVQLAAQGSGVYVVWSDYRHGYADVFFNVSSNGGASYAVNDERLDSSDLIGFHHSIDPQVSVSDDSVYVVWEDERNNPTANGDGDIYINRSSDGGDTWAGDEVVPSGITPGKMERTRAQVASSGSDVYVVWVDERNLARFDVFANLSDDGGATWLADPVRLDSDAPGAADSLHPELAFGDGRAFVVWEDARAALDVFFRSLTLE